MLLLTGASGLVGSELRRRLLADGQAVRCLVRDPRRLGDDRVRVQIALGDLADPPSFRNALRGVDTVVHLAAAVARPATGLDRGALRHRDVAARRRGTARRRAALRLLQRARREHAEPLAGAAREGARGGGGARQRSRDDDLRALDHLRARRALPHAARPAGAPPRRDAVPGLRSRAASRRSGSPTSPTASWRRSRAPRSARSALELAGPEILTHEQIVRIAVLATGRRRRLLRIPTPVVSRALRMLERADRRARVRDLGRARADGGLDGPRRRPRRCRGARRAPAHDGVRARPQLTGGRSVRAGAAASRAAASASSAPSPAGRPTSCTPERQPVVAVEQRQRERGQPAHVEDRRERREVARRAERAHRLGRGGVERAERERPLRERRRDQRVVALEERDERRACAPGAPPGPAGSRTASRPASAPTSPSSSARCRPQPAGRGPRVLAAQRIPTRPARRSSPGRAAASSAELPRQLDLLDAVAERLGERGRSRRRLRALRVDRRVGNRRRRREREAQAPPAGAARRARTARRVRGSTRRRRPHSRRAGRAAPRCRRPCA